LNVRFGQKRTDAVQQLMSAKSQKRTLLEIRFHPTFSEFPPA